MIRAFASRLTFLAAALMLALASVDSAARMAPGPEDTPLVRAAWVLNGIVHGAICNDASGHVAQEHHCPFCRLLADPPEVSIAPREMRLSLAPAWGPFAGDQLRGPQQEASSVSARGPPTLA